MGKSRITLSGAPPPDSLNGLVDIHGDLLERPGVLRVCASLMDVSGDGANYDRDERWPIVRTRHIENITIPEDVAAMHQIMARALAQRTGGEQLPFTAGDIAGPPEKKPRGRKAAGEEDGG